MSDTRWTWLAIGGVAVVMVIVLLRGGRLGPPPETADIAWQTSIPAAAEKPKLVYFTADWCPPCKTMKAETWPDDAVEAKLREFDAVYVDVDDNPTLAGQYGIRSIPTVVALGRDGSERGRFSGLLSARELLTFLDAND